MPSVRLLFRENLPDDTVTLARDLIGKLVVRTLSEGHVSGRIVETEAYAVGDAAAHAFRGMTQRNRSLFLEPRHRHIYVALLQYVYLSARRGLRNRTSSSDGFLLEAFADELSRFGQGRNTETEGTLDNAGLAADIACDGEGRRLPLTSCGVRAAPRSP